MGDKKAGNLFVIFCILDFKRFFKYFLLRLSKFLFAIKKDSEISKYKLLNNNILPKKIFIIIWYLIKVPVLTYISRIHVGLLNKFL